MSLCKRGLHDLDDPANVTIPGDGRRRCKACHRERSRRHYEANRDRRLSQTRKYQEANRERYRELNHNWYKANREEHLKRSRKRYEANREQILARTRKLYEANREQRLVQTREYQESNRERYRQWGREWHIRNPGKTQERVQRRRALVPTPVDPETQAWLALIANDLCAYCNNSGESDDHVVPLSRGGEHHWSNMIRACLHCNRSKGAKGLGEWLAIRAQS